ncbi:hypothetical protein X943_003023 [Babesia divergens]|uniref:Rieske domain-containing protein n=1 Tax=Babesia divergens TaxID=32595 RepID=A0AAD9GAN9_BABDI|nr:hypothetical protein X943_003023 [Babesia divergens]
MVAGTDFIDIGDVSEFTRKPRRLKVAGRSGMCVVYVLKLSLVAVFTHVGRFFAIDANCYHSAGPLEQHVGDIEDINGEPCIRCPLHQYIISLETGHSFYEAVEVIRQPQGKPIIRSLGFKSKGYKQRCHRTMVRDGRLLVQLDESEEVDSDKYAYK